MLTEEKSTHLGDGSRGKALALSQRREAKEGQDEFNLKCFEP